MNMRTLTNKLRKEKLIVVFKLKKCKYNMEFVVMSQVMENDMQSFFSRCYHRNMKLMQHVVEI